MRCPSCGQENPAGARFCLACGTRLPAVCAQCGAALPDGARFCPACGHAVPAGVGASVAPPAVPAVGAPPPAQSPATYTPRHLAERILATRGAIEGERKAVTVLFCDLVSSTELAETLGPEGMHALLGRVFDVALAEVHRYEGTINQFLGDGFMALFGAPLAHEDHARRAVLAALGIQRALTDQVQVTVRMGVHTGQVVVGAIGDNLRMDYTAVGDTTHLAARLQQRAEPGTILISEATARLVEGYVQLERLAPVTLKGLAEPVGVARVTGVGTRRSALEGPGALSPFVGRAREVAALDDLAERVAGGQGQAVGIVGEPGVGKSRLLLEWRQILEARGFRWLEGRCLSFGSAIPYLPVLDLVRAGCALQDADPPETVATKVREALVGAGVEPEGSAPYLLHLLGFKEGSEAVAGLGPEVVKDRTFEALRRLHLGQARVRPLALGVEDLHWTDHTSEEYLSALAAVLGDAPILLVGTYRAGYRPPWLDRSYATQIALARLATSDSLSVVRAILPESAIPDAAAQVILDRAEGNPFFLEELARAVREAGQAQLAVPETVQGVLAARIDRLPEPAKRVLQTASVLGREFPRRLLEAVWRAPGLEGHLRELVHQEFFRASASGDEPGYAFRHGLTQDVALGTLLAGRRRELHRRAAEARLALQPGRARELAPVLAHHYVEAETWPEAAEQARVAAEAARAVHANQEALARYDQALLAAGRGGLGAATEARLLEARAGVHETLGAFEPARADLEAALARLDAGDGTARARVLGALAMLWGGHQDYGRGIALAQEAAGVAERAGDPRDLAEARWKMGILRANRAEVRAARESFEAALATFAALGDEPGQARALDALGMARLLAGDLDGAIAATQDAAARLHALGDRATEASALAMLSYARALRGEWAAGEAAARRSLALGAEIGLRSHQAFVQTSLGWLAGLYGSYGPALRDAQEGLDLARAIGHREWTAIGLSATGAVLRALGQLDTARGLHEEELALARELGTAVWLADALGELGQDLAAAGDLEAGARHLDEAAATAGEVLQFTARVLVPRAELELGRGRPADALARARDYAARFGHFRGLAADARRVEGEALAALGDRAEARVVLADARARAEALGAASVAWQAALALAALHQAAGDVAASAAEQARARALLEPVAAGLPDDALRRSFAATPAWRQAHAVG
jgi:class 3 adenylate cyclase/tetratricopeptide (TPR) repeat protein